MQIPFVAGAYLARSSNIAADRCVNLYPELSGAGGAKSVAALIGCPGTRLLGSIGASGGIRGAHAPSAGDAIVVRGDKAYRVSSAWNYTLLGTLLTFSGIVSIANNGIVAVIVDGPYGYVINLETNAFNRITDADFLGADVVEYLDGYFIFNNPSSQIWYISSLLGTDFDALDFSSAEGSPDLLTSLIVDHGEVVLLGGDSAEVWYNSGDADFPFVRQNARIETGIASAHSVAKLDNSIVWLGKNKAGAGIVWRMQGYVPVRISTHAIEYAISNYPETSDAFAYSYQEEGHSFYVLTFPAGNATLVYDAATNLWHERAYRDTDTGELGRHRSSCHMFFAGVHVVGDYENGNLYALDLDYYSDNGDPMPSIRAAGNVSDPDYRWIYWDSIQVDIESGVGLQSGQGSSPKILLDWSGDGGHTWSNQKESTMGRVGEYSARASWSRLGRSRSRVNRITITDPVKRVILGASAAVRVGGN